MTFISNPLEMKKANDSLAKYSDGKTEFLIT